MSADNTLPVVDPVSSSAVDTRTLPTIETTIESFPGLWNWIARIAALIAAIIAARFALIIFYFSPFLGVTTRLDDWLDRQRCMVEPFCIPPWPQIHHFGLLMVIAAVFFFALALAGWPGPWRQERAPALDGWATRPRMTHVACILLLLTALEAVGYGAYQFLAVGEYPSISVWLGGIFASGMAAALWDLERPDELKRTVAYLVAALGLVCVVLGASALLANRMDMGLLVVAGILLIVGALRWREPSGRDTGGSLRPLDFALMLLFSLVALGLATWRAWSWKFAFVGDEWSFYYLAKSIIHEPELWTTPFSTHDSNRYHTVFSSMLQAWTMLLTAENVFGWRLSSILPVVFAVPGVYAFSYWLAGRQAAWTSAALMAGGHVLLTFSMVPYNNTQAVTVLAVCLGLFAFAQSGRSWLRYWLLGVGLGFGFLVFALARMVVLPIGALLVVMAWPSIRRLLAQGSLIALGGLVTAAPVLFNFNNWAGLLKATPVQSEVSQRMSLAEQIGRNALAGFLSFIANLHNQISHYVVGPHTDAATAVLMMAGIGCALAAILYLPKISRRALAWFLAATLFTFVVSAIQQYGQVSITRMYVLPPLYAIYGGVGGVALARLLIPQGERAQKAPRVLFLALLAATAAVLGQYHIERVSLQRSDDLYTPYALMVRQVQPADPNLPIFLFQPPNADGTLHAIMTAYELNWDRLMPITLAELQSAGNRLCAHAGDAMFLASIKTEGVDEALALVKACWPGSQVTPLNTPWDDVMIYRVTTARMDTSGLPGRFEK